MQPIHQCLEADSPERPHGLHGDRPHGDSASPRRRASSGAQRGVGRFGWVRFRLIGCRSEFRWIVGARIGMRACDGLDGQFQQDRLTHHRCEIGMFGVEPVLLAFAWRSSKHLADVRARFALQRHPATRTRSPASPAVMRPAALNPPPMSSSLSSTSTSLSRGTPTSAMRSSLPSPGSTRTAVRTVADHVIGPRSSSLSGTDRDRSGSLRFTPGPGRTPPGQCRGRCGPTVGRRCRSQLLQ